MLKRVPEIAWTTVNFYSSWESVSPTSGIKLNTIKRSLCPVKCSHLVRFCQLLQIGSTMFHFQSVRRVPLKKNYIQCTKTLFLIGSYPLGDYPPWWDHPLGDPLWVPNLILFSYLNKRKVLCFQETSCRIDLFAFQNSLTWLIHKYD